MRARKRRPAAARATVPQRDGRCWFSLIVALGLASPTAARAQAAEPVSVSAVTLPLPPARAVYTLRRCLELAARNYPKVHEARARLRQKEAQLSQAKTAPYSDFTVTGGLGLAPTVLGTNVYSPNTDVAITSNMGLAWQIGIDGAIPLWTFGKITSATQAAEAQVDVGAFEVKKEENDVKLSVRRAYYGVQLARDALILLHDATSRIDRYITRMVQRVAAGEGDDIELIKTRMYRAELDARESEAKRGEQQALSSLRFLIGVEGPIDIPDRPLRRVRHSLAPLARYLAAARLFRPEINMARAGVTARRALMHLEESRFLPDLALGINARWARAPEVTDQLNPFVRDQANFLTYGAALVLKWKLDFLPQSARLAQAEAQLEEMRATERYALGGVGVEVEQAFAEAVDAGRRLDAYTRASGYARQWLIKVQQGIDVGTFEDEDIVTPAKEYALKRFLQMNATFDYNVAMSKLALATGWDAVVVED